MQNQNVQANRWGGGFLALGFFVYALAVIGYVGIYGQPEGSGPHAAVTLADRVSHLQSNWLMARTMWLAETFAAITIAIAGFSLQTRKTGSDSWLSPRLVWAIVGVAGVLLFSMYPVMLGGYPAAAKVFESEPGLFAILNGIANFIFQVGNGFLFLGLAGAFHLESAPNGPLPRAFSIVGVLLGLIAATGMFGLLFGIGAMNLLAPAGLLVFMMAGYLGIVISRNSRT